jgi:hypothetical protein
MYAPHSRAIQHEETILKELDSMTPDDFRAELCAALISFYDGILKVPGAGGRPAEARIIKRRFAGKPAVDPPADAAPRLQRFLRPQVGPESPLGGRRRRSHQRLPWRKPRRRLAKRIVAGGPRAGLSNDE